MIDYRDMDKVKPGTELVACGARGTYTLTENKTYTALYGAEEGIFSSRPFVTVIGDDGKPHVWHLSRFDFKEK